MGDNSVRLPPEAMKAALAVVDRWQQSPAAPVACPVCGAAGLTIVDRSARPHTAWFELTCGACDLVDTISYPLGGTAGSWS